MLRTAAISESAANVEVGESVEEAQEGDNPLQYRPNLDNLRDLNMVGDDEEEDDEDDDMEQKDYKNSDDDSEEEDSDNEKD